MRQTGDNEIAALKARIVELEAELQAKAGLAAPAQTPAFTAAQAPAPTQDNAPPRRRLVEDDDQPIDGRYGLMVAGIALAVLLVGGLGVFAFKGSGSAMAQSQAEEELYAFVETAAEDAAPASWVYRPVVDPATGAVTRTACVRSSGHITLPPPAEPVRAELCLLDSDTQGRNAYVALLGPGGFACEGDCGLWARFDSGASQSIGGRSDGAAQHLVFLRNRDRFEASLRSAARTEVALNVAGGGVQQISFNTEGLKWDPASTRVASNNLDQRSAGAVGNTRRNTVGARNGVRRQSGQTASVSQNAPFSQQYVPIGQSSRQGQIVQGYDEPLPKSGEVFKEPRDVQSVPGVQPSEGLVGQQPIGFSSQSAGNQNPAPLPAGESPSTP